MFSLKKNYNVFLKKKSNAYASFELIRFLSVIMKCYCIDSLATRAILPFMSDVIFYAILRISGPAFIIVISDQPKLSFLDSPNIFAPFILSIADCIV